MTPAPAGAANSEFPHGFDYRGEGNLILAASAILGASGMTRGQVGNSDVFDAARDRLLASGYFDSVSYRYKPSASGQRMNWYSPSGKRIPFIPSG